MWEFPPRLPQQPIFYPVLNFQYADQIAKDWNTKSNSFAGYVTQFNIANDYIALFDPHIVGSRQHEEFWIPAEQLPTFNRYISERIIVTAAHFGSDYLGYIPERGGMRGLGAIAQFILLGASLYYGPMDFVMEIRVNSLAVFLHYPYWQ